MKQLPSENGLTTADVPKCARLFAELQIVISKYLLCCRHGGEWAERSTSPLCDSQVINVADWGNVFFLRCIIFKLT